MHKAVLVGAGVALLVMPTISPAHARTIAAPACTGLIPRSAFPTEMRRFLRVSTMRPQDYQALSASWREVVTYRWGSVEQDVIVAKTRVAVRTAYGSLVRSEGRDMT